MYPVYPVYPTYPAYAAYAVFAVFAVFVSRTGFSREGAGLNTVISKRAFTHQRLRLRVEEISGREDLQQPNRTF